MSQEWFKLEALQDYTPEDRGPSLDAWLAGNRPKALELLKTDEEPDFTKLCRQKTAQGVKLMRYHVFEEPMRSYLQWEIELYKSISIPIRGERVFLVNKKDLAKIKLPIEDFMLFDTSRAIVNKYDENGLMTHATFYDEGDDLSKFLDLKKFVVLHAKELKI